MLFIIAKYNITQSISTAWLISAWSLLDITLKLLKMTYRLQWNPTTLSPTSTPAFFFFRLLNLKVNNNLDKYYGICNGHNLLKMAETLLSVFHNTGKYSKMFGNPKEEKRFLQVGYNFYWPPSWVQYLCSKSGTSPYERKSLHVRNPSCLVFPN